MPMLKVWWCFPVNVFHALNNSDVYIIGIVGLVLDTGENVMQ